MSSGTTQEKNCRAHFVQAGAGGSSGTFQLPGVTSTSAEHGLLWKTAPEDNKRASPELLAGVKNCLAKG